MTEATEDQGFASRVRLVEAQPLAERAEAYSALHGELAARLDQAPPA